MVTKLQMVAHIWNVFYNKHYWVQFLAELWGSTANIKGKGLLQTFIQSQNESNFQNNSSTFQLKYYIKKFVL